MLQTKLNCCFETSFLIKYRVFTYLFFLNTRIVIYFINNPSAFNTTAKSTYDVIKVLHSATILMTIIIVMTVIIDSNADGDNDGTMTIKRTMIITTTTMTTKTKTITIA